MLKPRAPKGEPRRPLNPHFAAHAVGYSALTWLGSVLLVPASSSPRAVGYSSPLGISHGHQGRVEGGFGAQEVEQALLSALGTCRRLVTLHPQL